MICVTGNDYPLAYVSSAEAFFPYIAYLRETRVDNGSHTRTLMALTSLFPHGVLTPLSESRLLPDITVFLSSTCSTCVTVDPSCLTTYRVSVVSCGRLTIPYQLDVSWFIARYRAVCLTLRFQSCPLHNRWAAGPPLPDGDSLEFLRPTRKCVTPNRRRFRFSFSFAGTHSRNGRS